MELNSFIAFKKRWINNRRDMNDMWEMITGGGTVDVVKGKDY